MANTFHTTSALAIVFGLGNVFGNVAVQRVDLEENSSLAIEQQVEAAQPSAMIAAVTAAATLMPERFVGHPDEIEGWTARYFQPHEFASRGNGLVEVDARMVGALDATRHAFGKPIRITSGYRDLEHNTRVGGAKNSQHLHGLAVDIDLKTYTAEDRYRLMVLLMQNGFTSFGSYDRSPDMLHADMRDAAAVWDHGDGVHPEWFNRALNDAGWTRNAGPTKTVAFASEAVAHAPNEGKEDEGRFQLAFKGDQETASLEALITEGNFEATTEVEFGNDRHPKLSASLSHSIDDHRKLGGEGFYNSDSAEFGIGLTFEHTF